MRIASIAILLLIISTKNVYTTEYICSFDTMLTSDVNKYSPNYKQLLDVKSKSKFVFDISSKSLIINGEEYIAVFSSKDRNGFTIYSNRDFPYIMFHFYPSEEKIIMVGMQESNNDTFLKSDALSCHNTSRSRDIIPTPLTSDKNLTVNQQENLINNNDITFIDDQYKRPATATTTSSNTPSESQLGVQEVIIPPPK